MATVPYRALSIFLFILFAFSENGELKSPVEDSDVEVVFLHVISTIQARFATTLVTSLLTNKASTAKEITFTAQLPDGAFISNFSMKIDEKIIYGSVKEKDKAKAEFEAAKSRGESTGLVSKKPRETNAFTISVNVAAHSKVRFNLTYQEILKRVHGVYKHVINLQPDQAVSDLKVDVYITERYEIEDVKVPKFGEKTGERTNRDLIKLQDEPDAEITPIIKDNGINTIHIHYKPKQKGRSEISNGQLVVLYDVKRDKTGGDIDVVNGYFVHFFAPEGLQKRSKDIVFVLDKSGSMQGRKMTQLKDAMKTILKDLDSDDRFQIIFFSDDTESWKDEFVKANSDNVKAAIDHVDDTLADGGTNIYDSLKKGIRLLKKSSSTNVPMILFLTDGEPTVGETNARKIIDDNTEENGAERKILVHGVAFGDDADYGLLQKLSSRNKGLARRVYEDSDSSLQLEGFYEEISSPVLTNVKIDYLNETVDTSSLVNDSTSNYYDGSEMVVIGKVRDDKISSTKGFSARVSGQGAHGIVEMPCRQPRYSFCRPEPVIFYDDEVIVASRSSGWAGYPWQPRWCCPPPYCCGGCHDPPIPPIITTTQAPKVLPATSAGGFIERMWAYQTIKKLLRERDLRDGDEKERAKKRALELSLKYHFVTELTSMVVVKPDEPVIPVEIERWVPCPTCAIGGAKPSSTVDQEETGEAARPSGGAGAGFGGGLGGSSSSGHSGGFRPPPPPKGSSTSNGGDKEKGKSDESETQNGNKKPVEQKTTPSTTAACKINIVFIKDNSTISSSIDSRRKDYITSTLNYLKSKNNIDTKSAIIDAFSNGQGSVLVNMDTPKKTLDYLNGHSATKSATFKSGLTQLINGQLLQDSNPVNGYVVFLVTSNSVQYAVDASSQVRSHGAAVYVVSFSDDKSSGFLKTLNSISQDPARVFTAPPSSGSDLARALAKC